MKKYKLDKEEQDLLDSFERGEWHSVENLDAEKKRHQQYANNTIKKDRRVNIRMTSKDLAELQNMAMEDGIPYQTLISSVLHRYVGGRLVDSANRTR